MPVSMVTNKNKSEYVTIIIYPLSLKGRTALPYCYGILSLLNITYFLFGVNKIGMAAFFCRIFYAQLVNTGGY